MSAIGYRQQNSTGPHYHPERDFAYITPTLMRQAIENMSIPPHPELAAWKAANGVSEAEIILAATALADAQHDFVNAADPVSSLHQALQRRKYFDLPLPVRLLMQAMVGEVMIGAWFAAVREVTQVGEESPAQNEMCRFSSAVREFVAAQGAPTINAVSTAETVLARHQVLRDKYEELRRECAELRRCNATLAKAEANLRSIPRWILRLFSIPPLES